MLQVSCGFPNEGAVEPGIGKARINHDSPVVVGERASQVAFELLRCTTQAVQLSETGVEFDRLVDADRAVQVTLEKPDCTAIAVNLRVARVKPDCLIEVAPVPSRSPWSRLARPRLL